MSRCAIAAEKPSQCDRIFDALREGKTVTQLSALILCGCLRLSERIRELQRQGVPIEHEWQAVGKKRVMGYRLGRVAHG